MRCSIFTRLPVYYVSAKNVTFLVKHIQLVPLVTAILFFRCLTFSLQLASATQRICHHPRMVSILRKEEAVLALAPLKLFALGIIF